MSRVSISVFGAIFAAALVVAVPALAVTLPDSSDAALSTARIVTPIGKDKGCRMVCTKRNGDTCEKFEMKCEGGPAYQGGDSATQGSAGAAPRGGRPNLENNEK